MIAPLMTALGSGADHQIDICQGGGQIGETACTVEHVGCAVSQYLRRFFLVQRIAHQAQIGKTHGF